MENFDISGLKPEDVRDRPAWWWSAWWTATWCVLFALYCVWAVTETLARQDQPWAHPWFLAWAVLLGLAAGWWTARGYYRRDVRGAALQLATGRSLGRNWNYFAGPAAMLVVLVAEGIGGRLGERLASGPAFELCTTAWIIWFVPMGVWLGEAGALATKIIREVKSRGGGEGDGEL